MTKTILVSDWDSDNVELDYLKRWRSNLIERGGYDLQGYPLELDKSLGCDVVIIDGHQAEIPPPLAGMPFKQFIKRHVGPMTEALNGVYMDHVSEIHAVVEPIFRGQNPGQSFTAYMLNAGDLSLFSCWFLGLMAGHNSRYITSPIKLADPPLGLQVLAVLGQIRSIAQNAVADGTSWSLARYLQDMQRIYLLAGGEMSEAALPEKSKATPDVDVSEVASLADRLIASGLTTRQETILHELTRAAGVHK